MQSEPYSRTNHVFTQPVCESVTQQRKKNLLNRAKTSFEKGNPKIAVRSADMFKSVMEEFAECFTL